MATPDFIVALRTQVGHDPLWLSGCSAVVLRDAGSEPEVLLVQRADDAMWTVICGILEPGEPPHLAAIRECAEETGVEVAVDSLVLVGVDGPIRYPNGDVTSYLDHTFRAHVVGGQAYVADEESVQVGWFKVSELPEAMTLVQRRRIAAALADPARPFLVASEAAADFPDLREETGLSIR